MKEQIYKLHDQKVVEILMNEALQIHNTTIQEVKKAKDNGFKFMKNGKEVEWYDYYTFEHVLQYEHWMQFCLNFLCNRVDPPLSYDKALQEFLWLDQSYGLTKTYEN